MRIALALIALSTAAAPARGEEDGRAETHVLIVGVNHSGDPGVEPLQFADDDAARYAEVLAPGAASLTLLTLFDAESQRRFPDLTEEARLPTLTEFERATTEVFSSIQAAVAAGREADLLFVYTGHGGVSEHGEGYVWLRDHRLQRSELFARLVTPSPARFNHIIVDACSAYYLLNRGREGVRAVRSLLATATLADHPNTGALLATSRDRVTHEWTQIGGGVFSHQILGALSGAADVDGDRHIRYDEIGAFVEAANEGIRDRRARIDLYLRPPSAQLTRPVWRPPAAGQPRLVLAQRETGHFSIADGRGVPVADVNKNSEQPLSIVLTGSPPFAVERGQEQWQSQDEIEGAMTLVDLVPLDQGLRSRSAVAVALERGLYSVPFGRSYVRGYRVRLQRELDEGEQREPAATPTPPRPEPDIDGGWSPLRWVGMSGLGLGGAGCLGMIGVSIYIIAEWQYLNSQVGRITAFEAQDHYSAMTTGCCAFSVLGLGSTLALLLGSGSLGIAKLVEQASAPPDDEGNTASP